MEQSVGGLAHPEVAELGIKGFFHIKLVSNVLGDDARGTFREVWQTAKMTSHGLPEFQPVQFNVAESGYGVIRGIHAEPWEKYIYISSGTVFGAWVDMRTESTTFGQVLTLALDNTQAVFVPRGVGNSYAVTSERAIYNYLTTEHWQPDRAYASIRYDDPALGIDWPIAPGDRVVSDKDRQAPTHKELFPDAA